MPDLSRIGEREKLRPKVGDEPHWRRLRQGVYLGYRPSKRKAGGTWFARIYDPDTNRNARKRLGDYGTLSGHDVFRQAKVDAETWAETVESGGELARHMVPLRAALGLVLKPGAPNTDAAWQEALRPGALTIGKGKNGKPPRTTACSNSNTAQVEASPRRLRRHRGWSARQ